MNADMTNRCGKVGKGPFAEHRCSCGAVMLVNAFAARQTRIACGGCGKVYTTKHLKAVRRS